MLRMELSSTSPPPPTTPTGDRRRRPEKSSMRGAAAVEYALLIAFIATLIVAGAMAIGQWLLGPFNVLVNAL